MGLRYDQREPTAAPGRRRLWGLKSHDVPIMFGLQVLRLSHHVSTMISLIRGSLPSAMRTGATRPQERALVPRRALASVVAPGARVSTDERL